jgi:glycosyltransferase involved in cell wall biosynthesis
VVYNGFDVDRLGAHRVDGDSRTAHETTVAVMSARMHPEKDWRLLLQAAEALEQDSPGWKFIAAGYGPDREALLLEASHLVQSGLVSFPDCGLEVLPVLGSADIGVLLSNAHIHAEGCSTSILEYMACGLPVVCTDSGGNQELVEDGVTGLIVPPGDLDALRSALRTLREDPPRAREMGRKGQQRLQEQFTVDAMVAGFLAAYESAIQARRRGRS